MKGLALLALAAVPALAQQAAVPFSRHYLPVKPYSQQENEAIVKKFEGLRVTDVVDGLDVVGLQDVTIMDQAMRQLWRDEKEFTHRIYGVAVTLRIVPPQERAPIFPSMPSSASGNLNGTAPASRATSSNTSSPARSSSSTPRAPRTSASAGPTTR